MKMIKNCMGLLLTAALVVGGSCMAFAADNVDKGSITVNGKGIVMVDPDKATIRMAVETTDKTAKAAQDKNSEIVKKAVEAMRALGVGEKDIVTSYYSVYPQYRYDEKTEQRVLTGYRAYNGFEIITKDVEHTGKYIDAAVKAGVTNNKGVSFSLENPDKYYAQALKLAVENASTNATVIAEALGSKLGNSVTITEYLGDSSYIREAKDMDSEMVTRSADLGVGSVDIRYNKIDVSAKITVTYRN